MKKILLINNGYPSKANPHYTAYIQSIKTGLEGAGCAVDLLVMDIDFGNSIPVKLINYLKYYWRLFSFRQYSGYDYVYINNYPHSFLPLAFRLKRMKNLIIHWHGADIIAESACVKILNQFSYAFIPSSCRHISPSGYFAQAVAQALKIPRERIFVSPSGGVDTDVFVSHSKPVKKGEIHLGFASHVSSRKGFDLFYRLIEDRAGLEAETGRKFFFHYINYGEEKDFYNAKLASIPEVTCHEVYAKNNMHEFYALTDILLLSTRLSESLGLVGLEAMSCGVPVAGTDGSAMAEYIVRGTSGCPFAIGDYGKMRKSVIEIVANYETLSPRKFILENYSMDSVINGYKEFFQQNESAPTMD